MALLMDTHTVLWMAYRPDRLSATASQVLLEEPNVVYSIVSLWEIGLKMSRVGFDFEIPDDWHQALPAGLFSQGIERLDLSPRNCRAIQDLPFHHKDPFDRMLIAQAQAEGLTLLSKDPQFRQYEIEVIW